MRGRTALPSGFLLLVNPGDELIEVLFTVSSVLG